MVDSEAPLLMKSDRRRGLCGFFLDCNFQVLRRRELRGHMGRESFLIFSR